MQCSSSLISENSPDEDKDISRDERKRGSISEGRRRSLSPVASERRTTERRISLSLPKEKKAPLLLSRERRQSLSDRRQSLTSQAGGKRQSDGAPSDAGGLSCTSSQASYTDDFVDNLTKLKLNLQLKGVTDRMFEVIFNP